MPWLVGIALTFSVAFGQHELTVYELLAPDTYKFEGDDQTLKVHLAAPVPKGGVARIRIYKTYEDAASYSAQGDQSVFERLLGIRRNVIVLAAGYELIGSSVPAIVSTQPDAEYASAG